MSATLPKQLPTHLDLPDTDGLPVHNSAEPTQTRLLTESLRPVLQHLHPDGKYFIGQDTGIYYRLTDPPLKGCKSPDWCYIPGVDPVPPDYPYRRSYVMWHETVAPLVLIEYVSDDSRSEWDQTPKEGKFWVYETVFRAQYYAIHDHATGKLEVFQRINNRFELMKPNERGRYPIDTFGVELGVHREHIDGFELDWLRWFDKNGTMLPSDDGRAKEADERAKKFEDLAAKMAAKLRELGVDPNRI